VLSEERLTPRRMLDLEEHGLVLPKPLRLEELVEAIERQSSDGPVSFKCALRSAAAARRGRLEG
jgi:hypothetical protein